MAASQGGHEKIVRLLIAGGADISAQSRNGTALIAALEEGHEKIVRLLRASGADISAQSNTGPH